MNQVKNTVAEIKGIPTQELLLEQLRKETLVVTFNKLDGDERVMTCTKSFDIIPEEHKKFYSEKIIFLPNYQPNTSEFPLVDNNLNRTKLNIPVNKFVFSCFNNSYKITPCTFDSWARILLKVDNSVLVLFEQNEITKQNLQKEIMNRGVAKNRLIFTGYLPKPEYFARFKLVNLYLDTTPYNGGTTSSDALRMGLPVLTCIGKSFSSRLAASILKTLDLSEMITLNPSQYEERAIYLAKNPKQ